MKLSKYEKETVINFNEDETTAIVYTYNKRLINKLSQLKQKSPECKLLKQDSDCVEYEIPKKWIKINMPRQYSEEQRQEMADRLRDRLKY